MATVSLLDRTAPDGVCTDDLPPVLAFEIDLLAGRADRWLAPDPRLHRAATARALLVAGRPQEARSVFGPGRTIPPWTGQGLASAAWVASRIDLSDHHEELARAVDGAAVDGDGFLAEGEVPLGPHALFRGLVLVARGRLDEAAAAMEEAVAVGDARAPVWGARARLELHRVARTTTLLGPRHIDVDARRGALVSAQTFFAAGGYHHLRAEAAALAAPPPLTVIAHPALGHLTLDPSPVVGFGVQPPVATPAGKGLLALRHLLANRHRSVPAFEIARLLDGQPPIEIDLELSREVDADDEMSSLLRTLVFDDPSRSRVGKLVRRTIGRIAEVHPGAGQHLGAAVTTGYLCRYDADEQVRWRL